MSKQGGFTLIEVLVTVVMVTLLVTVAVPSFNDLISNNRLTVATNDLISSLNSARSEAIKRSTNVSVCRSPDGVACAGGKLWEAGWIIFTDSGAAGVVDGTDEVLFVHPPLASGVTLRRKDFENKGFASFQSDGQEANSDSGYFDVCDGRSGETKRRINVTSTGRAQLDPTFRTCS